MSDRWSPDEDARRFPDEPGPDWPSRDLDQAARSVDPWAGDDLWGGSPPVGREPSTQPASGWDDWPPVAPPDEPSYAEPPYAEPEPPTSDPWQESWDRDVPEPEPPPPVEPPPTAEPPRAEEPP
ncbi:MAG: hypothetical protein ACRDGV_09045, partial [Candidatus Limnocylindria bacterium]